LFTLDVDGERFAIRPAGDSGTAYDWLSGPNTPTGLRDLAVQERWTRNGHRLMIMVCDDS
jgi:hypothetical protein